MQAGSELQTTSIIWFSRLLSILGVCFNIQHAKKNNANICIITCSKIANIPLYNLIFTININVSSILITIISCDYLNLSLANEYVGDVTIPTQVIKYNQNFLQSDQPIRLQYSNQIKLLLYIYQPPWAILVKLSEI